MRNVTILLSTFLVCLVCRVSIAQSLQSTPSSIEKDKKAKLDKSLKKYEVFTLDNQAINDLIKSKMSSRAEKNASFSLSINEAYQWNLTIEENDLRSPEYKSVVATDTGEIVQEREDCHTYKGFVDNDTSQYVRLTINKDELKGYVKQKDDFVIIKPVDDFLAETEGKREKQHKKGNKLFIAYKKDDIKETGENGCGVTEAMEQAYLNSVGKNKSVDHSSSRIALVKYRVVEVATEADGEWFAAHGANANAEILTILNQVEGVYWNTFRTRLFVTFQHVFNNAATDPFNATANNTQGTTLLNQLRTEWQNNRGGITRDMVHLFSGRALGITGGTLWGQAAGLGTVCRAPNDAYAFSKNYPSTFFTTAHEIGHLFDGVHGDGQNCTTPNRTIMCQGETTNNFVFSTNSRNRIETFITNNGGCMEGVIFASGSDGDHTRICSDRTTRFAVVVAAPNSRTFQWRTSSNLRIVTGTNTDLVSIRATSSNSTGSGWIEAVVSAVNTNDQVVLRRDNILVGRETKTFNITGPSCVRQGQTETFAVDAFTTNYSWTVYDGTITSGQNSRIAYIRPTSSGGMYITVNATGGGECGGPNGSASNYYSNCNGSFNLAQETTVFPNPTSNSIHIETRGEFQVKEMTFVDQSSKVSKQILLQDNKADVDVSDLKPGLYFVKYTLDGRERVERIIVE